MSEVASGLVLGSHLSLAKHVGVRLEFSDKVLIVAGASFMLSMN
jgi:hypothetical protein